MSDRVYIIERIFYEKLFRKGEIRKSGDIKLFEEYPFRFVKMTD